MCKDPAKCKTHCTSTFTPERQAELLTKFWERQECMVGRYKFIDRHVDESAIQRHQAQHDERRSVARKFHLPGTDGKIQVSQIACQLLCLYLLLTGAGVRLCCFRRCSPLLCPSLPLLPFCFRLLVCVCPSVLLFCFASAYLLCVRFGQGLCKLLLQHSRHKLEDGAGGEAVFQR